MTDPIHEQCGYEVSTSGQPLTDFERGQVAAYEHASKIIYEQSGNPHSIASRNVLAGIIIAIDNARNCVQRGESVESVSEPANKAKKIWEQILHNLQSDKRPTIAAQTEAILQIICLQSDYPDHPPTLVEYVPEQGHIVIERREGERPKQEVCTLLVLKDGTIERDDYTGGFKRMGCVVWKPKEQQEESAATDTVENLRRELYIVNGELDKAKKELELLRDEIASSDKKQE